jgi:hypothetical protein
MEVIFSAEYDRYDERRGPLEDNHQFLLSAFFLQTSWMHHLTDDKHNNYGDNWIDDRIVYWTGIKPEFDVSDGKTVVHGIVVVLVGRKSIPRSSSDKSH